MYHKTLSPFTYRGCGLPVNTDSYTSKVTCLAHQNTLVSQRLYDLSRTRSPPNVNLDDNRMSLENLAISKYVYSRSELTLKYLVYCKKIIPWSNMLIIWGFFSNCSLLCLKGFRFCYFKIIFCISFLLSYLINHDA